MIAHRGANREAQQNTMTAFALAVAVGAKRIELDVHLSADQKLVIFHDFKVPLFDSRGKAKGKTKISEISYNDIRCSQPYTIPNLDEVLEEFGDKIELNLEIKPSGPATADATARAVLRHKPKKRIIFSSFKGQALEYLAQTYPLLERACLLDMNNPGLRLRYGSIRGFMQACQAKLLHPHMKYVNERLMRMARAEGWQVCTWAPLAGEEYARERSWQRLLDLGVAGHCTNYPREMVEWLKA